MKKKMLFILIGCLLATGSATAKTVYSGYLVNGSSIAVDTNYDLDIGGVDSVSAVVAAASVTATSPTFSDGRTSTGSFTVVSLTDLATSYATNKITVLSTNSLTGAHIRFMGVPITEGVDWNVAATKALTATAIAAALNTKWSGFFASTAPASAVVIYSTAVTPGSGPNAYTFTSDNSSITVNSATFSGGKDYNWVQIGSTRLRFSQEIAVGVNVGATATNMAAAFNASAASQTVTCAAVGAVVTATSTAVGANTTYGLTSSTPTGVTASSQKMVSGADASYTINTPTITVTAHGLPRGYTVWLSTTNNVGLSPLTYGTTYFIIPIAANSVALSLTSTGAVAGLAVTLTSSRTATTAGRGCWR